MKRVGVPAISGQHLTLQIELNDGTIVGSNELSEGLLYYLAFAALPYLKPVSVLLLEEPENGLHPSRIEDVMRVVRAFSKSSGTQVLMATHSPLVINCLEPDEVTVVTRPDLETGTVVTPIRETPDFDKRHSVYALGELWLSFADGTVEAPLLGKPDEAASGG